MQEKHLFEYAVIRLVPKVEREEFLNVGLVLYCAKQRFLKAVYELDKDRLKVFSKDIDLEEIEEYLKSFARICEGGRGSGPIGKLDAASRFRWLTAARSTVIQTSKVHPGFCKDPQEKLMSLFEELAAAVKG